MMGSVYNIVTGIVFCSIAVVALTFAAHGIVYRRLNLIERLLFLVPVAVVFFPTPLLVNIGAAGVGAVALLLARRGRAD